MNPVIQFTRRMARHPQLLRTLVNRGRISQKSPSPAALECHITPSPALNNGCTITSRLLSSTAAPKFEVINIQDIEDFQKRVVEASSTTPVVVDFHANWCGPCRILGPRLETILSHQQGKVVMAKVDIDDNDDLAMQFGVRSVPMVVGIKNGKSVNQFVGVVDDDQIKAFVDKLLIS